MKILFIFGTRPETIKLAPLIQACRQTTYFDTLVCVTAQHRSLLDQMLQLFNIQPDYDLNLMQPNQDLLDFSSQALQKLKLLFEKINADLVVVQGDTASALMASLAATYRQIPVAHIEAGLRSRNPLNPFPEEINRTLIGQIARWHFSPTQRARENLLREGVDANRIFVTGNTVVDSLNQIQKLFQTSAKQNEWNSYFKHKYNLDSENRFVLITSHRRESFGPDMEAICQAIRLLVEKNKDMKFIFPVHPNPNVKKPVEKILGTLNRMYLVDPLDYEPFLYLLMKSSLVLTDSGGVQEEAPSFGVPVVVMRKETERPELVDSGFGEVCGTEVANIVTITSRWLSKGKKLSGMNPFGDGLATSRILEVLRSV